MVKSRKYNRLNIVITEEERQLIDFICENNYMNISDLLRASLRHMAYNDEQIQAENIRQIVRNKGF